MARDKKEPSGPKGCPAWLATYGDMITLVLTFFVLLYSFSTIDANKWQAFVSSWTGKTPAYVNDGNPNIPDPPSVVYQPSETLGDISTDQSWSALYDSVMKFFDSRTDPSSSTDSSSYADIGVTDSQIIITLAERMLFDSGRYNLRPDAIEELAALMVHIDDHMDIVQQVVIEGHADTVAVVPDAVVTNNMDLSYQRAEAIRKALMSSDLGFPESMFASKGQGEEYPHVGPGEAYTGNRLDGEARRRWVDSHNLTAEQRQKNRRCVIILEKVPD